MSDAGRTTTTMDIKVNLRDLNRLDTKLKETFGTARARDFNRGLATSEKALTTLLQVTGKLTAELARQRDTSKHFVRMADDIRDARRETEKLRGELEKLRDVGRSGGGSGGSGSGAGAGGSGGPGGAGGGWMSRAAGAQLKTPDAGSIATAMSSVPFIGLAAAGATMASYQMYGSALGYQTARRDTFSSLGPQGAAMLNLRQTQRARAGYATYSGNEDAARSSGLDASGSALAKMAGIPDVSLDGGKTSLTGQVAGAGLHAAGAWSKGMNSMWGWATPTFGNASNAYEKMVATGAQSKGMGATWTPGQDAKWSAPMSTKDLERVGASYGVKPAEALQEAGGLSSAMGRRASAGTYDFARSAQTYFGVDMGTTGSLMKSFRTAGGQQGQDEQANSVAQLIGSAVARGLEGSEISGYLESMAGFMQKQADAGQSSQMVDGLVMASERLKDSGFNASFSGSYAMRLGESTSQMGFGGGADPVKLMMLQKLGYGAGGKYTGEGYAEAMLRLQDPNLAAGAGLDAMSGFSDSMRASGMSPAKRALMMSRLSGQMGAQVGPDAARLMAAGIRGPVDGDPTVTASDITRIHAEAGSQSVGILKGEAGMEADRIGAGYKAAGQVQNFNGIMLDLANTVQDKAGPALDFLTGKVKELTAAARGWHPGAGSGVGSAGRGK